MENKVKLIIESLIKSGIDMNAFLKASGLSIKETINEFTGLYYVQTKKLNYKRKPLRY